MGILQSKVVVILFFLPLKVVISSRICVAQDNFEVFSLVLVAFLPAYYFYTTCTKCSQSTEEDIECLGTGYSYF